MHKSQGFGVSPNRGTQLIHFNYFAGDTASNDLFDGIDLSWRRVEGGKVIEDEINKIINLYNPETPETILPYLVELYNNIGNLKDKYWVEKKQDEVKELIKISTGLWMESIIWEPEISLGQNMDVRPMIINRSKYPIILEDISTTFSNTDLDVSQKLEYNKPITVKQNVTIPADHNYSQPYWLKTKHDGKLFTVQDNELIGNPENKPDIISTFTLKIDGTSFSYEIPAIYKWVDAVKGELTKPVVIRPDLSISVDQENLVFANGSTKEINVNIISKIDSAFGKIIIDLPEGWKSDVNDYNFSLNEKGDRTTFGFKVSPNNSAKTGLAKFRAILNGKTYTDEIVEIDYPHIQYQTVLKPVNVDLIKLEIEIEKKRIGYIMGSGDDIPISLTELGYDLELLSDEDLDKKDLSEYDVIICGIRAFNTRKELDRQQKRIIEFVEKGGTWIVQHNTRFGINVDQIGPYPFSTTGRDRIAEEDAKIDILVPEHQIFNYPNKITSIDFDGWVQERGLYFANSWEGKLYPLLAGNDEGENSKLGGLLYANYGKGVFIFTAYSWFRQLPAGVPGAYKIFVNMISAKGK